MNEYYDALHVTGYLIVGLYFSFGHIDFYAQDGLLSTLYEDVPK